MEIEDALRSLVAEQLLVDETDVTLNATLGEDLGADSLDMVELTMVVEEKFDFEMKDSDVDSWRTFGDIVEYVTEKVK